MFKLSQMIFHSYNPFYKIKIKNNNVYDDQLLFQKIIESDDEAKLIFHNKVEPELIEECDSIFVPYQKKILYPKKIIDQITLIEEINKTRICKEISPLRIISKKTGQKDTDNIALFFNNFSYKEENIFYDNSYNRWQDLKKKYDLNICDYHYPGNNVLLLLQVESDASLNYFNFGNTSYVKYLIKIIKEILIKTERKIILRGHPKNKWKEKVLPFLIEYFRNSNRVFSSEKTSLENDFKNSFCAVSFNSTSTLEALLYGLNVINLSVDSPCLSAASNDLDNIEKPLELSRESTFKMVSFLHWEKEELKSNDIQKYLWKLIKNKIFKKNDFK